VSQTSSHSAGKHKEVESRLPPSRNLIQIKHFEVVGLNRTRLAGFEVTGEINDRYGFAIKMESSVSKAQISDGQLFENQEGRRILGHTVIPFP